MIYFYLIYFLDLEELASNSRGRLAREALRQQAELEESKECSFRPKINDLSRLLAAQQPNHADSWSAVDLKNDATGEKYNSYF